MIFSRHMLQTLILAAKKKEAIWTRKTLNNLRKKVVFMSIICSFLKHKAKPNYRQLKSISIQLLKINFQNIYYLEYSLLVGAFFYHKGGSIRKIFNFSLSTNYNHPSVTINVQKCICSTFLFYIYIYTCNVI